MNTIREYNLYGAKGFAASITNFGAKITKLIVPDQSGEPIDIILGFDTLSEWQQKETYFNAIIGRYANRIKNGQFMLDGKKYQLPINNGTNSLHGGIHGFNEKIWDVIGQSRSSISLHYSSADGEEGYPGNLDVYVTYQLTRENALSIQYKAKTDAPTIIALTNHAYFNLNGESSPSIRNHELQIMADYYTPFDETNCPTGEIRPVAGSPMDFNAPKQVGSCIDDSFFAQGNGIDNNWVLRKSNDHKKKPELAAVVKASGRTMEVWTTMPGLQVYTGNYVQRNIGKSHTEYGPQNSICLEAQNFPDAPNHPNFPSPILRPGEFYNEQTIYKFR